jgi:hypothetical protein
VHDRLPRRLRWRAAAAIAVVGTALAAPGCAAFKATQQPSKKKLDVLTPGTPRSHVIAELGAPLWSEEDDGKRVDIFAFKQGYTKGAKAGRALLHGAADVVTGGLWEVVGIPAESLADGSDVKVEVVYDASRAVRRVEVIEGEDVLHPRRWWQRKPRPDTRPSTAHREMDVEDAEIDQATAPGA